MRIIIYTGKGGVGKTSIAAASACMIAQSRKKVLVISTDPAHSLGDSFDKKLSAKPQQVADNLWALEIDTIVEGEKSWGTIKKYLKDLLCVWSENSIEVEELLVFPGLEELFAMFQILEIYEKGAYDVLIVDCAPTGETLSLLKYPERLSGLISKVLPIERMGVKVAGPVIERLMKLPMPKDNVFDEMEHLMDKMERLQNLLIDKDIVSLRIVTTPEKIVIREAKRCFTCLHLYNYNVDAVIVNRIYPEKALKGYFNKWIIMQQEGLKEIAESFSEVPQFYLTLQESEVRTLPMLQHIGQLLFADQDITKVLFQEDIYTISHEEEAVVLHILLPFAEKEELDLRQDETELILSVKNQIRRFPLPLEVMKKDIMGAKLKDGYLNIHFA